MEKAAMISMLEEWIANTFGNPRMLWLLLITVPLLSLFLWWAWQKRQSLAVQFVQSRLLAHLMVGVSRTMQKTRLVLLIAAVGLLLLTLAQPRWGFSWEEAKQRGLDIVVALDTSRSMLAEDISPNRLARAKLAALDLMRLAQSDRLGLVAFAGTAFLQCPLTLDEEAFRQSVDALQVGIIPQGGTALTEAIETAVKAFGSEGDNHKVLVLLTDGEDHDTVPLEAAQQAAQAGLKIFTIGVGTPNGELLRLRDEKGALTYVKDDQGNVVKSRLNETLLTQIATAANGFYLAMTGANTMQVLYDRGLAPLPKTERSSTLVKRYKERYQWFLALAVGLLLLEVLLPERKQGPRPEGVPGTTAGVKLQRTVAVLLALLWPLATTASPAKALRKYEAGHFKEAEQEYQRLLERKPDDPRLHYNAGTAAYQAAEFDGATKHFSAALTSPDLGVQQRSYYNLGNSLYRLGEAQTDAPKKKQAWEQAVKKYEGALKLNSADDDAKFNLEFVKKKLEELQKQQDQSPQQNSGKDDQKDQKDQKDQNQQCRDQQNQESKDSPSTSESEKPKDNPPQPDQQEKKRDEQKDQGQSQKKDDKEENQKSKPENKRGAPNAEKSEDKSDKPEGEQAPIGQMTQEQVKRLLDAQKNEEKAMIFLPTVRPSRKDRIFKDW